MKITAIGSLDGAGQNGGDNNVVYQIVGQPLGVCNIGTITGYKGLTPMINSYVVNSTMGIDDKRNYPFGNTSSAKNR